MRSRHEADTKPHGNLPIQNQFHSLQNLQDLHDFHSLRDLHITSYYIILLYIIFYYIIHYYCIFDRRYT